MKFVDLLKARDTAIARDEECASIELSAALSHEAATAEHAAATAARLASHAAIRDVLADRGHHSITAPDGTIAIYQTSDAVPEGYAAYHPIPGEGA